MKQEMGHVRLSDKNDHRSTQHGGKCIIIVSASSRLNGREMDDAKLEIYSVWSRTMVVAQHWIAEICTRIRKYREISIS